LVQSGTKLENVQQKWTNPYYTLVLVQHNVIRKYKQNSRKNEMIEVNG